MTDHPVASVVVPTYQRRARVQRVLEALAAQTFPRDQFEVVVVSDGSTDGTDDYLTSGAVPLPIVPVLQDNAGPGAARNAGIEHARGELVIFVDDDVVPAPQLVAEHVAAHRRLGDMAVVLGPMLDPPDHEFTPWVAYEQAMLAKQYEAMGRGDAVATARQFYTGNASVARRHLVEAGGFDTEMRRAEDLELAYRLLDRDLEFSFVASAAGHHYAERSFQSWFSIPYSYGRADAVFGRDRGQGWILTTVTEEFGFRHPVVRGAVRLCVGHPWVQGAVLALLRGAVRVLSALGAPELARPALSLTHNVRYYQGFVDELDVEPRAVIG